MTIIAVTMVRDEADIIEPVLRHLLAEGVDHLIVADNLSRDDTYDIVMTLGEETGQVTVVIDPEPGYYQSRKMSALAVQAYDLGADWVLPFDADEVWYSRHGTIAEALARVPEGCQIVRAGGWDHIVRASGGPKPVYDVTRSSDEVRTWAVEPAIFSPWRRAATQQLAKVAFRAHPRPVIHMGNHDVNLPDTPEADIRGVLEFRHFQYRSLEQMTRKLRNGREAYEASDIHEMHGTHWRHGGAKTDDELAADWAALCSEEGLVFDPAPLRVVVA